MCSTRHEQHAARGRVESMCVLGAGVSLLPEQNKLQFEVTNSQP